MKNSHCRGFWGNPAFFVGKHSVCGMGICWHNIGITDTGMPAGLTKKVGPFLFKKRPIVSFGLQLILT